MKMRTLERATWTADTVYAVMMLMVYASLLIFACGLVYGFVFDKGWMLAGFGLVLGLGASVATLIAWLARSLFTALYVRMVFEEVAQMFGDGVLEGLNEDPPSKNFEN